MKSECLTAPETLGLVELLAGSEGSMDIDAFRQSTLRYLMRVFDVSCAAFYLVDPKNKSIRIDTGVGCGIDVAAVRESYERYYCQLDPFRQRPLEQISVAALSDVIPEKAFVRGEFYNDFLKQQGILHALTISLVAGGDVIGGVALCRSQCEPDFSARDKAKACRLRPFVGSALGKSIAWEHSSELRWLLATALQEIEGVGIVLLDEELNQVFSNARARRLLAAFAGGAGTTSERRDGAAAQLPAGLLALCRAQRNRTSTEVSGQVENKAADAGRQVHKVRVVPVAGRFLGAEKRYLCLTIEPAAGNALSLSAARAAGFGLTQREFRIIGAVASGRSNAQIAAQLFISCNTVKNHLKNIFAKVGVRSRTELLARLVTVEDRSTG